MALVNATGFPILGNNLSIGGNFDLNPWQRGTSLSGLSSGDLLADRWVYNKNGTVVNTCDKTASAPTFAQAGMYLTNCMDIGVSTADTNFSGTQYASISYLMEGYDFAQIGGGAFTISFWVYATITGTYCVALRNAGKTASWIMEYTVDVTNTWEYKTVTFNTASISDSGQSWNVTNGLGAEFKFALAGGTAWNASADTWITSDDFKTSNQVNACNNTANKFRLQLFKIETGTTASPYPMERKADVLSRCQRYTQLFNVRVNNTATQDNAYTGAPMRTSSPTNITLTEDTGSGASFTETSLGDADYNFCIYQDTASDTQNNGTVLVDCELVQT